MPEMVKLLRLVTPLSSPSFVASSPSDTSSLPSAVTVSTVSRTVVDTVCFDPLGEKVGHQLADHSVILDGGDNRSGLVAVPRSPMEQRMGPDQRQQSTEIPPLSNGKSQNAIRQLLLPPAETDNAFAEAR
jgi:hypothetical protein